LGRTCSPGGFGSPHFPPFLFTPIPKNELCTCEGFEPPGSPFTYYRLNSIQHRPVALFQTPLRSSLVPMSGLKAAPGLTPSVRVPRFFPECFSISGPGKEGFAPLPSFPLSQRPAGAPRQLKKRRNTGMVTGFFSVPPDYSWFSGGTRTSRQKNSLFRLFYKLGHQVECFSQRCTPPTVPEPFLFFFRCFFLSTWTGPFQ